MLKPAVRGYCERFFAGSGIFVELGCGTGEASAGVRGDERALIGLDISLSVLSAVRQGSVYRACVMADLRQLPFRSDSIAGVWNLGVMEHFPQPLGIEMLIEARRVLAPGGRAILFWPPEFGSSRWVLGPLEALISTLTRRKYRFFPDEVNRLRSRDHGREVLRAAGLLPLVSECSPRDGWIHVVAVGERAAD